METNYEHIARFLCGECNDKEIEELDEWRAADVANEKEFQYVNSLWTYSGESVPAESRQAAELWKKGAQSRKRFLPFLRYAAVFAGLLLCVGLGWFAGNRPEHQVTSEVLVKTKAGEHSEVILPDGSHVWLNSASELAYPSDFHDKKNRRVRLLEGEAVFQVTKNAESPFVVSGTCIDVKVYGTTFDVNAYGSAEEIEVSLQEGSIELLEKNGKSLCMMIPGEVYAYNKTSGNGTLSKADVSSKGIWRLPELKIKDLDLDRTLALISEWYGVDINLQGKRSSDEHYWMTIKEESLKEMLDLIAKITPMIYEINDHHVDIKLI